MSIRTTSKYVVCPNKQLDYVFHLNGYFPIYYRWAGPGQKNQPIHSKTENFHLEYYRFNSTTPARRSWSLVNMSVLKNFPCVTLYMYYLLNEIEYTRDLDSIMYSTLKKTCTRLINNINQIKLNITLSP